MCAGVRFAADVGYPSDLTPDCAAYDVEDAPGDPLAAAPIGGVALP